MTRKNTFACKHAILTQHKTDPTKDLITAKITQYDGEGNERSFIHTVENYKRPFYIVEKKYRKFKDKKSYIKKDKVRRYETNQSNLGNEINRLLHGGRGQSNLGQLKQSPYIFGIQTSAPVYYKESFYKRCKETQEKASYSVAAYDVETDIDPNAEDGIGPINMASITFNDRVYWCGRRDIFHGLSDREIIAGLKRAVEDYLDPEYIERHQVAFHFELADTEAEIVQRCVHRFHTYSPDFVVSWNANFDMKRNELALRRAGIEPEDVYSAPEVPKEYRHYEHYEGREKKRSVGDRETALLDYERFPVLSAPAGWQWFDGMSFYAKSRVAAGKPESMKLDDIARKEGVPGKLYTDVGSDLVFGSVDWHKFILTKHPFLYAMYNIQDNFVIEDINRKTQDYSFSLPALIRSSELKTYESQPKLLSDVCEFIALENDLVWGVAGYARDNETGRKFKPQDMRDWIAILSSDKIIPNGVPLFKEADEIVSRAHPNVFDIDITAGYPTAGIVMNVSDETTMVEVCEIEGFDRFDFREFSVNYASGVPANACSLASSVYNFPALSSIKDFYLNEVMPFIEKNT